MYADGKIYYVEKNGRWYIMTPDAKDGVKRFERGSLHDEVRRTPEYLADDPLVERTFAGGVNRNLHTLRGELIAELLQIVAHTHHTRLSCLREAALVIHVPERVLMLGITRKEFDPRAELARQHERFGEERCIPGTVVQHDQDRLQFFHISSSQSV